MKKYERVKLTTGNLELLVDRFALSRPPSGSQKLTDTGEDVIDATHNAVYNL